MTASVDGLNFLDPALMEDPFEADRLARKEAPVYKAPGSEIFVVFSYDLIDEVLSQPELYSSRNEEMMLGRSVHDAECQAVFAKGWPQAETLLNNDPPSHTRFRKLVRVAFAPGRMRKLERHISATVDSLINEFIDDEACEFIEAFAMPLPAIIIAEQMGIPASDIHKVKEWSNAFIELIGSFLPHEEELKRAEQVVEFQHYLKARIDERRDDPGDDMLSVLVHSAEDGEKPLNLAELLNVAQQLIVAGNTTTTHMLAAGLYHLIRQPSQMDQVRADRELIPKMVEELLRMETPTYAMWRRAVRDAELGEVEIPAGSQLLLRFGSANRDEKYFEDAQRFDINRKFNKQHMAFSKGVHTCIGANLARKELVCSFEGLLGRLGDIRLDGSKAVPAYLPNLQLRGVDQLSIRFRRIT